MAEIRSTYVFDKKEEFENAKDAMNYHIGSYSSSTWDWSGWEIYIFEDCPDITKAASICKEHGGKYKIH